MYYSKHFNSSKSFPISNLKNKLEKFANNFINFKEFTSNSAHYNYIKRNITELSEILQIDSTSYFQNIFFLIPLLRNSFEVSEFLYKLLLFPLNIIWQKDLQIVFDRNTLTEILK